MGNCLGTTKKSAAEIAPSELMKPAPVIKLYGHPDSFATSHVRLALSYKPVTLQFVPSDAQENPTIMYRNDVVTGSVEEILRYLDAKFPDPPVSAAGSVWGWCGEKTPAVVWVVMLQHRSMGWHLERMEKWAEDMVARGGNARGDPSMGSPRMEVKKFAKSYSQLQQVLLEHAQMEEKVMFQILESADRGLCKSANEDHARDLPIMNGIKEEIKIIGVMNAGSPDYQEALGRLLSRLKKLKENCKQHFEEEERELLPLMEATDLNKVQHEKVLQQSLDAMRETHSHLFRFFMEGLCPQDGMHYFGLIKRYCDNVRASLMLHMTVEQ
ncbi:uncharacterized protein LOC125217080 [Salvia hispanica]|uniref:uncharacterized protein LOC125217080 n=1 Tax=Salvia hispanica TaxID=49212 RepID=UPI002009890C|nr:uncharacterized protein LOC125217080 [Salvia hispanica]XP_047974861.1 uncharacterized protein LOC125217080 [Salvia hispanica]